MNYVTTYLNITTLDEKNKNCLTNKDDIFYSSNLIMINHPKELAMINSDNKLYNSETNSRSSCTYVPNVKLTEIFFCYDTFNLIKIC